MRGVGGTFTDNVKHDADAVAVAALWPRKQRLVPKATLSMRRSHQPWYGDVRIFATRFFALCSLSVPAQSTCLEVTEEVGDELLLLVAHARPEVRYSDVRLLRVPQVALRDEHVPHAQHSQPPQLLLEKKTTHIHTYETGEKDHQPLSSTRNVTNFRGDGDGGGSGGDGAMVFSFENVVTNCVAVNDKRHGTTGAV